MDAIILAAGKGSRMAPLCTQVPKPMLPLAGKPILQHVLERVHQAGVGRAVIVVEHLADAIERDLHAPEGMEVVFVRQGQARGTGHAVHVGAQQVDGDALVLMGDSLVAPETLQALAASNGFAVAAARVADPRAYGVLEIDGPSIIGLEEKPAQPATDLANTGMYAVPAEALAATRDLKASPRGELEFTDIVHALALTGQADWVEARDWFDIGSPWQYLAAHEQILPAAMANIEPRRADGPGAVEIGAHIRGRVRIERGATTRQGRTSRATFSYAEVPSSGPTPTFAAPSRSGPAARSAPHPRSRTASCWPKRRRRITTTSAILCWATAATWAAAPRSPTCATMEGQCASIGTVCASTRAGASGAPSWGMVPRPASMRA